MSLHIRWHSELGPQEVTRRKGKPCRGPRAGEPLPHGHHRKRERTGKTKQKAGDPQSSGILSKYPFPPFAKAPTKSPDPRHRVRCHSTHWVKFFPGTTSPCRNKRSKRQPHSLHSPRWAPGKEDTQVFPGASERVVSQVWHPPPKVKPQTKTTQLPADLQALPGDGGAS